MRYLGKAFYHIMNTDAVSAVFTLYFNRSDCGTCTIVCCLYTVRSRYIAVYFLQITPERHHSSPVRARYGCFPWDPNLNEVFTFKFSVLCDIVLYGPEIYRESIYIYIYIFTYICLYIQNTLPSLHFKSYYPWLREGFQLIWYQLSWYWKWK